MEFTHFDENGNALMVDVSEKAETKREATARGSIYMSPECLLDPYFYCPVYLSHLDSLYTDGLFQQVLYFKDFFCSL